MIVEQMGGEVKVTSEQGVGSLFSIILRLKCNVDGNQQQKPMSYYSNVSRNLISGRFPEEPKNRLLLANDDPFQLVGFSEQLGMYFDVETAENGLQAVEMVAA
jgi:hypothetical protein